MSMMPRNDPPILIFRKYIYSILKRRKSCWASLPLAEKDEILSAYEAFNNSTNSKKINLSLGVYRDEKGNPVILKSVQKAEKILNAMNLDKDYQPPLGSDKFRKFVAEVALGKDCPYMRDRLNVTAQGLGRTGSMRVATSFIKLYYRGKKVVYLPSPTWPPYKNIILSSGLKLADYAYYDFTTHSIDFNKMMSDIKKIPGKSVILLDECGQTPTGIDPTYSQWDEFSELIKSRDLLVIMDMSSQGFASGDLETDAYGLRKFIKDNNRLIVLQSFSKNMGLYGERVGACTILAKEHAEAQKISSQMKIIVRTFYSNPPLYGARIVAKILENSALRSEWKTECRFMATRLKSIRKVLVDQLKKLGSTLNWDHINNQTGSYGFLGLKPKQVEILRDEHNIFLTTSGCMFMDNVNMENVSYIAFALHMITRQ